MIHLQASLRKEITKLNLTKKKNPLKKKKKKKLNKTKRKKIHPRNIIEPFALDFSSPVFFFINSLTFNFLTPFFILFSSSFSLRIQIPIASSHTSIFLSLSYSNLHHAEKQNKRSSYRILKEYVSLLSNSLQFLPLLTIDFLDRIYLGAYDFTPPDTNDLVYFTVEDVLAYNPFHLDFGPLHIGSLYRFAVILHNILNEESNQGKAIVFYSSTSPKERANAACLLCCYMVLVQSWSPHQVLQPISQVDPPLQPFRDAGYSNADFEITIQDVVYGMWRAKERGMIVLTKFNLEEYEQYERVEEGDFNVISKDFIAFASPKQNSRRNGLNEPFRKVLNYFMMNNVDLVVRLNSHLYDSSEFTKRNIQHIDMIFEDGTCPSLEYVQKFIGAAECVIQKGGKVAVHCKAGLGRTGCLIGAHLIYTHGFTANECIAYMRMMRPGMVVGPQQHWLYLHQNDFRDWRHTMCLDDRPDEMIGGLYPLTSYEELKARLKQEAKQRKIQHQQQINSSMSHIDSSFNTPIRRRKISGALAAKIQTAVPVESPGQPRKYQDQDENSGVVEVINNSDEEDVDDDDNVENDDVIIGNGTESMVQEIPSPSPPSPPPSNLPQVKTPKTSHSANTSTPYDVEAEIHNADGTVLNSSPKRESSIPNSNDWKVLRSISTNSAANQPCHLTKTTTTTTTRTVSTTLSSSPRQSSGSANGSGVKTPKSRSGSRPSSGMIVSSGKVGITSPGHGHSHSQSHLHNPHSHHNVHNVHGSRVQSSGIRKVSSGVSPRKY